MQKHTESVRTSLLRMDSAQQAILTAWKAIIGSDETWMFPLALLASGAAKRVVSARSLLRTHIDTALRFLAAWLVHYPHEFAAPVIAGQPINKLRDREGRR